MARARVAVAYSGGRDSTALLHATLRAAEPLGIAVIALHVHHGLSPNADVWLAHCRARCERWARSGHALGLVVERAVIAPAKGESVEAWARKTRYAALREMALAQGASLVLLAQHRRDQAETFLLQALRGAGVAGLAGMPRIVERDGITWMRPWLAQPGTAIEAYVRRYRLTHIEDESNQDERFARNRLRLRVWPGLVDAFPQAETSFAGAAAWSHEAAACMAELAALDLALVAPHETFDLGQWSALSQPRRSNALRAWLRRQTGAAGNAALVVRLMAELTAIRSARWPMVDGELRSHRGVLSFTKSAKPAAGGEPREALLRVRRAGTYALPGWAGVLRVARTRAGGVALSALGEIDLLPRSGAEQFQAGPGRPPRSLKKQYQAAGVAAWQRNGPLVFSAGRLIYVPGLGLDARALARSDETQMTLDWIPRPPG